MKKIGCIEDGELISGISRSLSPQSKTFSIADGIVSVRFMKLHLCQCVTTPGDY